MRYLSVEATEEEQRRVTLWRIGLIIFVVMLGMSVTFAVLFGALWVLVTITAKRTVTDKPALYRRAVLMAFVALIGLSVVLVQRGSF